MKKLAMLVAVAALGVAAPAMAQPPGWYAGAGYTNYDAGNDSVGAATARLGYQFNRNWGVEGEGSFGVNDDDTELDNAWGIYGTGAIPVTTRLDVFGRVGYQTAKFSGDRNDDNNDGVGYGAGLRYQLTDRFGIRGEYTRLDNDQDDIDTWGVGGTVNF